MKPMRSLYFCSLSYSEHLESSLASKEYKKLLGIILLLFTVYEIEKHEQEVFANVTDKYIHICIYSNNLKIDGSNRQRKVNTCQLILFPGSSYTYLCTCLLISPYGFLVTNTYRIVGRHDGLLEVIRSGHNSF